MIEKTYTGDINDIDFGEEIHFKTSICFTKLLEKASEINAKIIIRTPYNNLEDRGKYIITEFSNNYTFIELKNKLESLDSNEKNKIWLLNFSN